jgi:hypothetical protein
MLPGANLFHLDLTQHDPAFFLAHEARDPTHYVEILTSSDDRNSSRELMHVDESNAELTSEDMPRRRRVGILAPGWRRVACEDECPWTRQFSTIIWLRFDLDPKARIAAAVTHRTPRLDHHVGNGAMDREVSVERSRDDAIGRRIEPFGSTLGESDEERDCARRTPCVERTLDVALIGL